MPRLVKAKASKSMLDVALSPRNLLGAGKTAVIKV